MKLIDILFRSITVMSSVAIIILGARTLLVESIFQWGVISMAISLFLLAITTIVAWRYRASFFSLAAFLYSSVLVGRLFSTLRFGKIETTSASALDPLLVGETGPGIPSIMYLSYALVVFNSGQLLRLAYQHSQQTTTDDTPILSMNDWAITFIRVYVGLMFIGHYSGHVLAGPQQFQIFVDYFTGEGLNPAAPMVILAGVTEIAVSIGLVFGLMTRIAAVSGVAYLFFATLWGHHFSAGYVWVLPNGGWEFSALWMAVIFAFSITGGSNISIDALMKKIVPQRFKWSFR
jgi:putative oxidoreductase